MATTPSTPSKTPARPPAAPARPAAAPTKAAPRAAAAPAKAWRDGVLALFLVALVALPVGVALGLAWVDFQESSRDEVPKPAWVTPETIRATTTDGVAVKTKVSIDAATSSTRSAIERRLSQVGLLLQASVSAKTRQELTGAQGLADLSEDMLDQLNGYLKKEDVEPARAVVVQDFLISPP